MTISLKGRNMAIPELDDQGFLPPAVYDCTMTEIENRFAQFQGSDRRIRLFEKLRLYAAEAKKTAFVIQLLVNGSFVSAKPAPSDIDLVVVLAADHDLGAELRPFEYNVVSKKRVRQAYKFDILVAVEGSQACSEYTEFFQQIRGQPDRQKGILRVTL